MGMGIAGGMIIIWIVLIILVVVLVRVLFHSSRGSNPSPPVQPPTARSILEQRYARGEINQEQFKTMLKDLEE